MRVYDRKDVCYTRHKIVCTTRFVLCVEKMPSFTDGKACLLKPNAGRFVQDSSEAFGALCILTCYDEKDCRQIKKRVPTNDENVNLKVRKFNVYKNKDQTFIAIEAETVVTKDELVIIKRKDPHATFSPEKLTGIDTVVTFCAEKLQKSNAQQELKIPYTGENRKYVDALVQSTSIEKQPMQNRRKSFEKTTTTTHIEKTTTMETCTVVENEVELVPQKKREVGTLCYYYMHAGEEDEANKNLHLTIVRITKVYKDESFGNKSSPYLYDAIAVGYGILEKKIIYFTKEGHPKFFKGKFQKLESCDLLLYTDDVTDDVNDCILSDCLRNLIDVTDEELLRDKVWTPLAKNEDEIEHDDVHQLIQTPRKKKQKTKPSNDANEVRVIENTQQYAKNWANDVNENDSDDDDSKSNTAIEKNNIPAGGALMNQAGNMPSTDLFENASFLDVNSYGNNTTILSLLNEVMVQLNQTKEDVSVLKKASKANQSELQSKLQELESEIDTLRTMNSAKEKELDDLKSQIRAMQENNQVATLDRGRPTNSPTLSIEKKIELVQLILNLIAEFGLISTQGNKSSVDIDRQSAYFEKGDNDDDDDDMNVTSHKVTSNFLFMVSASKFFQNVPNGGDNYRAIQTMYTQTVGINLTRAMFTTLVECSKFAYELWSSIRSNSDAAVPAAPAAPPAPAGASAVAGAAAETDRAQIIRRCHEIIIKFLFPDSKNHEKVFQTAYVDANTWKDQMIAKSDIGPPGFKDRDCYLNLFGISRDDVRTENGQAQHYYESVPNKVDHPFLIYLAWLYFKRTNSSSTSVLVAPEYRSLIDQAKPSTYIKEQLEGGTLDRVKQIHAEYLKNTTFYANEFALLIYHLKRIIAVEVDCCKDFIMKTEKRMELFNEAREQVKEYMDEYDAKTEEEREGCLHLIDWKYQNSNSDGVETDANNANSDE